MQADLNFTKEISSPTVDLGGHEERKEPMHFRDYIKDNEKARGKGCYVSVVLGYLSVGNTYFCLV